MGYCAIMAQAMAFAIPAHHSAVIAFSAGLLLGSMCEMGFGVFLLGVGGISLGLLLLKKK